MLSRPSNDCEFFQQQDIVSFFALFSATVACSLKASTTRDTSTEMICSKFAEKWKKEEERGLKAKK